MFIQCVFAFIERADDSVQREMAEGARLLAEYMAAAPAAVREAYDAEKRANLALSEQAVYHAIHVIENTDWSVSEQLASLYGIVDGLHAAKLRRATSCIGDPDQVDGVAWSILRADPAAHRLCELYVRLQLVLGLRSCCKIGVKCQ